ncbi:MAG: YcgN family cysteine cluster protein [Congregibacter sp.]
MDEPRFWESIALADMDQKQWESLCDGCGRCCLHKLQDADTGEIHYTNVACRLFNEASCQCRDYPRRQQRIPDCMVLTSDQIGEFSWLPDTCAYRVLSEGGELPLWHPLITGDRQSVVRAGISVRGRVVSEEGIHEDDFQEFIIDWVGSTRETSEQGDDI